MAYGVCYFVDIRTQLLFNNLLELFKRPFCQVDSILDQIGLYGNLARLNGVRCIVQALLKLRHARNASICSRNSRRVAFGVFLCHGITHGLVPLNLNAQVIGLLTQRIGGFLRVGQFAFAGTIRVDSGQVIDACLNGGNHIVKRPVQRVNNVLRIGQAVAHDSRYLLGRRVRLRHQTRCAIEHRHG